MNEREERFQQILVQDKRRTRKVTILSAFLLVIVISCFEYVGFFAPTRMAEGVPAIWTLLKEMFPPNFEEYRTWLIPLFDTLVMSIAGTALAVAFSVPLGLLAAANTMPNKVIYFTSRIVLNLLRAIPELILGIIFVAAVGFGALPGVLALGLHSAGMVGKFFAEAIEHVNEEPIEAARSMGASSVQVIRYGVMPQVFSQLADVCIYRWEYNFRASTVMGMVGAGGIGAELIGSLRIMQYQEVSAILIIILVMVTVIDWIGAWLRKGLR